MNLNSMNYFGDLAPKSNIASTDLDFTRPGFGINATYRMGPNYSLAASANWGRLQGDDFQSADPFDTNARFRYVRNLSFRNDIKELTVFGIFDLYKNKGTYITRVPMTPYVAIGLGVFHHNPQGLVPEMDDTGQPLTQAGKWVNLQPLGTEGQFSEFYDVKPYSKIQINIPVMLGVRFRVSQNMDFAFEVGYRHLFTDFIDDVSGYYTDPGSFTDPLARTMADRSREVIAVKANENRDFEAIGQVVREVTIASQYDGQNYIRYGGYGFEHKENNRGNSSDNDIYLVTSLRFTYVLSGSFKNAKFR